MSDDDVKTRTLKVDYLARVEGEGALTISTRGKEVVEVALRIFEPPRFFEAFLRGRSQMEVPDITARICGICPVAYQMSACHAVEDAHGVRLPPHIRELRRLLYCGEWIESHVLHMFMLHAPDFLGYQDSLQMAKDHGPQVQLGLRTKKAGNAIVQALGGREIHPINVKVGGFYRLPSQNELRALLPGLKKGLEEIQEATRWMAGFHYPSLERDYEYVAVHHPDEYGMNEGAVLSSRGLSIPAQEYEDHYEEVHVQHSTALHSRRIEGGGHYFVGPMARMTLNWEQLPDNLKKLAEEVGVAPPMNNPYRSLLSRGVETAYAFQEAIRIVEAYDPHGLEAAVEIPHGAGTGRAATEAPRGMLFHRYEVDDEGDIVTAKIVPPTSQNQATIEDDLREIAGDLADMPAEAATWRAEQTVRNYDPCISCSTHFLKLKVVDVEGDEASDPA